MSVYQVKKIPQIEAVQIIKDENGKLTVSEPLDWVMKEFDDDHIFEGVDDQGTKCLYVVGFLRCSWPGYEGDYIFRLDGDMCDVWPKELFEEKYKKVEVE